MPFVYRLQKILDFRIKKKEEQLEEVRKAQAEVQRIEGLIEQNKMDILSTRDNMRQADPMMYESYDNFLKSLYDKGEQLEAERQEAEKKLEEEKLKLVELEKAVKVLEKHKEKAHDAYKEEEKRAEMKKLDEVGSQKHFAKMLTRQEEEMLEELESNQ